MKQLNILLLILGFKIATCQQTIEVVKPIISDKHYQLFDSLRVHKHDFQKAIDILEVGLKDAETDFEQYRIIMNLGFLYTKTGQHNKCINMWNKANEKGLFFPFEISDHPYPLYLEEYKGNERFDSFILNNKNLVARASKHSKADYFVNLPNNYDAKKKYPAIFILHGGMGDFTTFLYWNSGYMKGKVISVYPRGREVLGSFARRYGDHGINDITEIYNQVVQKYPVDTTKVILAGQSAGGTLALYLAKDALSAAVLLMAFPVVPDEINMKDALQLKEKGTKVTMICGKKDELFYDGQKRLAALLDSTQVIYKFIEYENLGHDFPDDFDKQIDEAIGQLK